MIVIAGFILGAITGGLIARRRKGAIADIALYSVVYAMLFATLGLILTLLLDRLVF